jgi:hypothetical protein
MNTRLSSLTRRITAIKRDFSKSEIQSAVKLLEKQDSASPLLPYLSNARKAKRHVKPRSTRKPIQDQRSRAVIRLEHKDREKYRLLSELDSLLRAGTVLPRVNDIKRLGESLTKDFTARSSRRESISKLMEILSTRSLHEIGRVVEVVLRNDKLDTRKSDYERLSDFIITGSANQARSESESPSL